MPERKPGESDKEWVNRCIEYGIKEEGLTREQAAGKCYGMLKENKQDDYQEGSFKPPTPVKGETITTFLDRCKPLVAGIGYHPQMVDYCCLVSWDCWVNDEQPPEFPPPWRGGQDGDGQTPKPEHPYPKDRMPLGPPISDGETHQSAYKRELYMFDMDCDHALSFIDEHITELKDKDNDPNKFNAIAIKGDCFYKGKFLSFAEIEKAHKTMDGAYHDINHWGTSYPIDGHPNIEYIIGYQKNTMIDPIHKTMKTDIIVNPDAPHYKAWKNFVDINKQTGRRPNVSVSFWADNKTIKARDLPMGTNYNMEGYKEDSDVPVLTNLSFQALSTVFKGACDDKQGCGIGLNDTVVSKNNEREKLELMIEIEKNKIGGK